MPILAAEPNVFPDSLFEQDRNASERRWWVLHTRPRQEKSLTRQLHAAAVPFFLPLVARRLRIRGRVVTSHLPLFPGYCFLLSEPDERLKALATKRIVRSLPVLDQEGLWRDLQQIYRLISSGAAILPEDRLAPGTLVEIRSGPLAGLRGKIVDKASRRRFVVAVDFIQRGASVLLDDFTLAAVCEWERRASMKKIFVTGGAGFIGSAFIRLVRTEVPSLAITNFDALTYAGNLDNLEGVSGATYRFVRGNIGDRSAVLAALDQGSDAIVNFAAESHVDRSIASADAFLSTNVLGTQVLLDAARVRGVGRFVQVSTDEVMGSLPEDEQAFFTESSPFAPNSPYAASKAAAEHLVRAAHHTFGLDTVITRCGNNYGPRQFPEKLIPLLLANALADEPVPVYGDGRNVRDWIYVDDHCRAILCLLERGTAGEVYNIGARNQRRNIDVVESVLNLLGKPLSLIRFVKDRPGHDRRYAIDPHKIETELGWRPRETWQTGLAKTIRWYQDNTPWVERARSGAYREFYVRQYGAEALRRSYQHLKAIGPHESDSS